MQNDKYESYDLAMKELRDIRLDLEDMVSSGVAKNMQNYVTLYQLASLMKESSNDIDNKLQRFSSTEKVAYAIEKAICLCNDRMLKLEEKINQIENKINNLIGE